MLLDQDKDIVNRSKIDLQIYQRALMYSNTVLSNTKTLANLWDMVEIRFVQDLGLAKPGYHPNGMKYKDMTIPLFYFTKELVEVPLDTSVIVDISRLFAERVLEKAKELKAIEIIIGYHYR